MDPKTLKKASKQPKFVKSVDWAYKDHSETGFVIGDTLSRTCSGDFVQKPPKNPTKCHLLHNFHAYLKLAPVKVEILLEDPYRALFHDFLSQVEIQHLINISIPNLSLARIYDPGAKKNAIIHKTVQYWFKDVFYDGNLSYSPLDTSVDKEPDELTIEDMQWHCDIENCNQNYQVLDPLIYKLSKRLELVTKMSVISRFASTDYQVSTAQ